jgi:iron complex outermembrane receptor protein
MSFLSIYRVFAFTLLLSVSYQIQAQIRLKGTVSDSSNGSVLQGANLMLSGSRLATVSQPDGMFSISAIPAGDYRLQVSFIGYETRKYQLSLRRDTLLMVWLSRKLLTSEEVLVTATRASDKTATTFSTLSREAIANQNLGQDLPMLLANLPSVVVTSDAGAGVGYTGIRIRGSDPTRVNVTLNGIPINDAESQGVFWVNMPDMASSLESIQVQRGVGTSTNGAGAFGATLNMQTSTLQQKAFAEVNNTLGSFGTRKHTFRAGTGLLENKWAFEGRLSRIYSQGYIDRAFADLHSWFASAAYYGKKSFLKLNVFSGNEQTYQAWAGVPQALLNTQRTFNPYTYDNQTDNYRQDHYHLYFNQELGPDWELNLALHYTKGKGYFEEFLPANDAFGQGSFAFYGLPDLTIGDSVVSATDLVRRRWLDNDFYGGVYALIHQSGKTSWTFGGSWNRYDGHHFGELIWARFAGNTNIRNRYYQGTGDKQDFTSYFKVSTQLTQHLGAFADLQYRYIDYAIGGQDPYRRNIGQAHQYHFFNPKAGLTWGLSPGSQLYVSYSVAHREPTRDDFIQAIGKTEVKPERLDNLEAGWKKQGKRASIKLNYFWMNYQNQLVLTGQVNDVGAFVRTNVARSYRSGIEAEGRLQLFKQLQLLGSL